MRTAFYPLVVLTVLSACSETPIEEQGEEAIAELETQLEAEAKSLEEAADEAVKVLEAEIEDDLGAEGVPAPDQPQDAAIRSVTE